MVLGGARSDQVTMSAAMGLTPTLFDGLFDDAAIFPPGDMPMRRAVQEHIGWKTSADARFTGLFICSDTRLDELLAALPSEAPRIGLSLVVPQGAPAMEGALHRASQEARRLQLSAVELPAEPAGVQQTVHALDRLLPAGVLRYVEVPLRSDVAKGTAEVAGGPHRLKLRTGGTTRDAFPDEDSLAAAVSACITERVPFKLTAGLHHATRHADVSTGFEQHGFLNVILAVAQACAGAAAPALARTLAQRDPDALVSAVRSLSLSHVARVRRAFVSFGTCSLTDPLEDLRALGLLSRGE
jgi:hypothetical protein